MAVNTTGNKQELEKGIVQTELLGLTLRYEAQLKRNPNDMAVVGARKAAFDFAEVLGIPLRKEVLAPRGSVPAKELAERLSLLHREYGERMTVSREIGDRRAIAFYKGKRSATEEIGSLIEVSFEKEWAVAAQA
jgi:hypothetical protein